MIEELIAQARLLNHAGDAIRNIVSKRVSEDLFDDLSPDATERAAAERLELQVKPAVFESHVPIIDRPFEEGEYFNAIGFPFTEWFRSRYSDGGFGVWYGADCIETTVAETVHHWLRFLADAGHTEPGMAVERKVYAVRCEAALIDLRPALDNVGELRHPTDYSLCQQVGSKLHREGHPGLITRSARCDGDVLAIFNSRVLSNPRNVCYLTYIKTADGVRVEREPGKLLMQLPQADA